MLNNSANSSFLSILLVSLFILADASIVGAREPWFASFYGGVYSDTSLIDNLQFRSELDDTSIYVFSLGKQVALYADRLAIEFEGQIGIHAGIQDHQEINAAFILRWLAFPWDRYVNTSFAFGNGISYATDTPDIEVDNSESDEANPWLYYILAEWTFALSPQWDIFWRIHHRSGVFGLVADHDAGSNFIGLGLRFRFN